MKLYLSKYGEFNGFVGEHTGVIFQDRELKVGDIVTVDGGENYYDSTGVIVIINGRYTVMGLASYKLSELTVIDLKRTSDSLNKLEFIDSFKVLEFEN